MSQLKRPEMNKKTKFSQRNSRFECIKENHKKSDEICTRRFSEDILQNYKIRCRSRQEKDKEYLEHCKKIEQQYKIDLKKNDPDAYRNRLFSLKRCEFCLDPTNTDYLMFCNICEDSYHCFCLNPPLNKKDLEKDFTCQNCRFLKNSDDGKYIQTTINQKFEMTIKRNIKRCNFCYDNIEENEYYCPSKKINLSKQRFIPSALKKSKISSNFLINEDYNFLETFKTCIRCKKDFHKECFVKIDDVPKKEKRTSGLLINLHDKNICCQCQETINKTLKDASISNYFKFSKQKNLTKNEKDFKSNTIEDIVMFDFDKEKKNTNIAHYPKFILWKMIDNEKMEELKRNLFKALLIKNIEFSDDLVFLDPDCGEQKNNALFEPGIQKMSSYNKAVFYKFKERTRRGEYPGLEILEDQIQGYIVKTSIHIKKNTLLCEYTGEVCLLRKKLFATNDSIMELIRNPSSSSSLVICPEKKGNIARFLSGINNQDKNSKKKQNVNSSRYNIDGKVHVLLYASKNIKKDEILYYDYNAGGSECYPTENFI